jgi:hypothetical protein
MCRDDTVLFLLTAKGGGFAFSFTHLYYAASPYHSDSFTSGSYQKLCCILGAVVSKEKNKFNRQLLDN